MELTYDLNRSMYLFECTPEEKRIPKLAKFAYDSEGKRTGRKQVWYTQDPERAARLLRYADSATRVAIEHILNARELTLVASRAEDADISIPVPEGLNPITGEPFEFLPFQRAGVAFASSRPSTLIADEMGLGKTIEAIGVINLDPSIKRVCIVCPASLKINWKRELETWLTRPATILILDAKDAKRIQTPIEMEETFKMLRLQARILGRPAHVDSIKVMIINYDILGKFLLSHKEKSGKKTRVVVDSLGALAEPLDFIVVDECHYVKNPEAQRSVYCYRVVEQAARRVMMSGTPLPNKPVELWPIIHLLDPATWPKSGFFKYVHEFCDAKRGPFGWDFSGASNLPRLQDILRKTIMIRRLKGDVLKELPPKRRQVIELPVNGAEEVVEAERAAFSASQERITSLRVAVELAKANEDVEEYRKAVMALRDGASAAFRDISRLRHMTALAKVPYVIGHLKDALDDNPEYKIIVFAHHLDVIEKIGEAFKGRAVRLTGQDSQTRRQEAIDLFQCSPKVQLFIGGLTAAGVGITLTASAHVVFAELDWVPGNLTQAEDRAHRKGQRNAVLIQHLVLEGSLDAVMAKRIVKKQTVIDAALDRAYVLEAEAGLPEEPELPIEDEEEAATYHVARRALAAIAAKLSTLDVAAAHTAVQMLAGMCDGARSLDGAGFNKIDKSIGHSLAERDYLTPKMAAIALKLARRYRRQLPDWLNEQISLSTGE